MLRFFASIAAVAVFLPFTAPAWAGPSESIALNIAINNSFGYNLQLVSEGPLGNPVPPNLSTLVGSVAFAKDVIGAPHTVAGLNDGLYGNSNSWIGSSNPSFGGIALAPSGGYNNRFDLTGVAIGRDNTGTFTDRTAGIYTLQVTTVANPTAATPDASWTTIGILDYTGGAGGANFANPSQRHLYSFDPVSATGFRILTSSSGSQLDIDELELFGTASLVPIAPEPTSIALVAFAIAAMAGMYWRRGR